MNGRGALSGYLSTAMFRICFQVLLVGGMILYSAVGGDLCNICPVHSLYPEYSGCSYLPNELETLRGRKMETMPCI